jgi:hypothetical protein
MDFDFLDQGEMGATDAPQGQMNLGEDNYDATFPQADVDCNFIMHLPQGLTFPGTHRLLLV